MFATHLSITLLFWTFGLCPAANLTVGYLANLHGKNRHGHIISGAMTYAVRQVNEQHILPDNYTLDFTYEDTLGETLNGTRVVIKMWKNDVIAFFGPENSCEVEATVAASLNLPLISFKCADSADKDDLANKDYRDHFARTYPPNTKVTSSVFELLRYYKWYKFSIVYDQDEMYEAIMRSLERDLQHPFSINHRESFPNTRQCCINKKEQDCCFNPFMKIVENTSTSTRIYVFLGDIADVGKFLTALNVGGLLATGNYMVIYVDMLDYVKEECHKYFQMSSGDLTRAEKVMLSSQSLLILVTTPPKADKYKDFQEKVLSYNSADPFFFISTNIFNDILVKPKIPPYAAYLYDAVTLYADALGKALRNNTDPRNGKEIMRIFRERTQYTSVTGAIMRIDKDGGAEGNYTVLSWQPTPADLSEDLKIPSGEGSRKPKYCMLPVGKFYVVNDTKLRFEADAGADILWVNKVPPLDEPPCGFDGSGCSPGADRVKEYTTIVLAGGLLLFCVLTIVVYRNWKAEQEIDGLLWRLELEDIQRCGQEGGRLIVHSSSKMSLVSHVSVESRIVEQIFTHTAVFKGTIIAVKQLHFSKKIEISRKIKKEMKMMREIHHDNINQFVGASVDPNCIHIVTEYCSKGSLQDILENDDMKLDNMFIASLVFDLIKGMIFLNESDLKFHGNLKSSNCVVSSRWVLQVTDFGLHELRATAETGSVLEHQYYRNLMWKAPELLRYPAVNPFGSQKGDVYAFGIILHEIIARQGPFGSSDLTPREIVQRVKQEPGEGKEPFRPPLYDVQCQDYIVNAMRDAWHEKPEMRPDFHHLKERLRKMRDGMKSNIMDNMMSMMEKYAYNLEELVDERTVALVEEKKKTEALLHRMLPKSVANQLMRGEAVIPESFDAVTIYFSDIVGFTEMSATSTPMEVVTFLNDLYTVFDAIISHYDVYKVETIGDAYMVVSGLPIRNDDQHAGEIAFMALELLDCIKTFKMQHKPDQTLKLRIGLHTGPVCAGVVGLTMPRYCLFGDTVNTASRMESNGEALKIHISPQCKELLDKLGGYSTTERGLVKMKGKGEIRTYWLTGHAKGPKKRTNSASDSLPPLFNVQREEAAAARRRSPKLADLARRGSVATSVDPPPSPGGVPVFLRLSSDSPRSPKRLSRDPGKLLLLRPQDSASWRGSSCGELNALDAPPPALSSAPPALSPTPYKPEEDRNGSVNLDESMRPLLSNNRVDLILTKSSDKSSFLKPPVLKLPSKKWRSCDEIILPKGSRSSLKEFFNGLLGSKGHDGETKRANNISMSRMAQETVKEESLV